MRLSRRTADSRLVTSALAGILTFGLVAASPAVAQQHIPDVSAKFGLLRHVTEIGEASAPDGLAFVDYETPSFGWAIESSIRLPWSTEHVATRATATYAGGMDVGVGYCQDDEGVCLLPLSHASSSAVMGFAELLILPEIEGLPVDSYGFIGPGFRYYRFGWDDQSDSEADFAVHFGGGGKLSVSEFTIFLEISDYLSWVGPDNWARRGSGSEKRPPVGRRGHHAVHAVGLVIGGGFNIGQI